MCREKNEAYPDLDDDGFFSKNKEIE